MFQKLNGHSLIALFVVVIFMFQNSIGYSEVPVAIELQNQVPAKKVSSELIRDPNQNLPVTSIEHLAESQPISVQGPIVLPPDLIGDLKPIPPKVDPISAIDYYKEHPIEVDSNLREAIEKFERKLQREFPQVIHEIKPRRLLKYFDEATKIGKPIESLEQKSFTGGAIISYVVTKVIQTVTRKPREKFVPQRRNELRYH